MRHFTALVTRPFITGSYEAVIMDLPLPVVTGRSLSEVQDNLLTAVQHHIDLTCELACEDRLTPAEIRPAAPARDLLAQHLASVRKGDGFLLKIPEYLLTRS